MQNIESRWFGDFTSARKAKYSYRNESIVPIHHPIEVILCDQIWGYIIESVHTWLDQSVIIHDLSQSSVSRKSGGHLHPGFPLISRSFPVSLWPVHDFPKSFLR